MAAVDANYSFIFADVGCQGRLSDGAIFRNTELFQKLENHQLNLPEDEPLTGEDIDLPYVFVADDAFALSRNILKPYPGMHNKGSRERIFNYRLSRARRIVENVFGIMASVFRVLRKPMLLQPRKTSLVVLTCVLLHNFLRKSNTSCSNYTLPGTFDGEDRENEGNVVSGSWRSDLDGLTSFLSLQRVPRKPSQDAKAIRAAFSKYFVGNGKVSWQVQYC